MKRLTLGLLVLLTLICPPLFAERLLIGTLAGNPPFGVLNKKDFSGFEIELMREICIRIQAQCEFQAIDFHHLPFLLNTGKLDLGVGSIIVTHNRQKQFLFSLPYKVSYLQFMTLQKAKIFTALQLQGKKLGIYRHAPVFDFVRGSFDNNITLKTYEDPSEMLRSLKKGKINGILTNFIQASYWKSQDKNTYKLLGKRIPFGEGYAIMARKNNAALISRINTALLQIQNDGTYIQIYTRYIK